MAALLRCAALTQLPLLWHLAAASRAGPPPAPTPAPTPQGSAKLGGGAGATSSVVLNPEEESTVSAMAALKCCCDGDKGLSGLKCRYVVPKRNGGCPVADLGRGSSQTHASWRTDSNSLCVLTGSEVIDEDWTSNMRRQCIADEAMDARVFPVETFGDYAYRKAQVNVPGIGDMYLAIKEIHISSIKLVLELERKSDDVFSFNIKGTPQGGLATAQAYILGFQMWMPSSSLDSFARGLARFENFFANLFTLGFAGSNYASLENMPVGMEFSMSGDFKVNEVGGWDLMRGTEKHEAQVVLKNGGLLSHIVNSVIRSNGGMDQMFFDIFWPFVQKIIPPGIGGAFKKVTYDAGRLTHSFRITATCPAINKEGGCPAQQLKLTVDDDLRFRMKPAPILRDLVKQNFFGPTAPILGTWSNNLVAAYDRGDQVFVGGSGSGEVHITLNSKGLAVTGSPEMQIPTLAILGMLGPEAPIGNFVPKTGETTIAGSVNIQDGIITAKDFQLSPLVLPYGAQNEFLEASVHLEEFTVELEDAGGQEPPIFCGPTAPVSVQAPGIEAKMGLTSGFKLKSRSGDKDAFSAEITPEYMADMLQKIGKSMLNPSNTRQGDKEAADGKVPTGFERPFAADKLPLDLKRLVGSLNLDAAIKVKPYMDPKEGELVDVTIDFRSKADLQLGSYLFKGFTSGVDQDHGYLHHMATGTFGETEGNKKLPTASAVAVLSCGNVTIYTLARNSGEDPYAPSSRVANLDLRVPSHRLWLTQPVDVGGKSCVKVGDTTSWFKTRDTFFCMDKLKLIQFTLGIKLQATRFDDARGRWPQACSPGPNGKAPVCMGNPDGTWFQIYNPLSMATWFPGRTPPSGPIEIKSPRTAWREAISSAFPR